MLTWEDLFQSRIETKNIELPYLKNWTELQCEDVLKALSFGLQDYATKSKFSKFSVALSGGIDSALVLAIAKFSLKDDQMLEAIYMPSQFSSDLSLKLSTELCKNLEIPLYEQSIEELHKLAKCKMESTFEQQFEGIANENIQSRMRGMLLYARSNQINSMVINTSNKSEIAVGYSTQYGDSVGAISLLGDLYKSEVYQLSKYLNKKFNNIIPEQIITRPPSAELRENQEDSQSLPPYNILDAILDGLLSYRYSYNELIKNGFKKEDVEKVVSLYSRAEYKRAQFCPIIKVSPKSFGFGYRIPMSKNLDFYSH